MPTPGDLPHQDLVGAPYVKSGRDPTRGIDCLGVLLEVYRREGFLLPDPLPRAGVALRYMEIWQEVPDPDTYLDVLWGRRGGENVVWTQVDPEWAITAQARTGGLVQRIASIKRAIPGLRYYRLRPDSVPRS